MENSIPEAPILTLKTKNQVAKIDSDHYLYPQPMPFPDIKMTQIKVENVLENEIKHSFWLENESSLSGTLKTIPIDYNELQQEFKELSNESTRKPSKGQNDEFYLLSKNRVALLSIILSKNKYQITDIKKAILSADFNILTQETIDLLKRCLPTENEEELLKQHNLKLIAKITSTELFLKELIEIPSIRKIISAFSFLFRIEEMFYVLKSNYFKLTQVLKYLLNCEFLEVLMASTLKMTNFINTNTQNGQIQAVSFESFLKIIKIKSNFSKRTLFYFVSKYISGQLTFFQTFCDELKSFKRVFNTDWSRIDQEKHFFLENLKNFSEQILDVSFEQNPENELLSSFFKDELTNLERKSNDISNLISQTDRKFIKLKKKYIFNQSTNICEFLELFHGFVDLIEDSIQDIHKTSDSTKIGVVNFSENFIVVKSPILLNNEKVEKSFNISQKEEVITEEILDKRTILNKRFFMSQTKN